MKTDEAKRRPFLPCRFITPSRAVLQKRTKKFLGILSGSASSIRAANFGSGCASQNPCSCIIVQLEKFLSASSPIIDVWLVPHFPKPALYFYFPVTLPQVFRKLVNEFFPLYIIFRRIRPARENRTLRKVVSIGLRMNGKRLRHESHLHQGRHAFLPKRVKNPVHDFPVVNRLSRSILGVRVG